MGELMCIYGVVGELGAWGTGLTLMQEHSNMGLVQVGCHLLRDHKIPISDPTSGQTASPREPVNMELSRIALDIICLTIIIKSLICYKGRIHVYVCANHPQILYTCPFENGREIKVDIILGPNC
jgi:hypothetical protein